MAVRANQLKNFKGDDYITRPELEAAIGGEIPEGGLIDQTTGNLRHDLNPIHITSMKHDEASGPNSDDKTDQDFHTVKFIGNCDVQYNDDGTITIRIGDNLNSSLYNKKDGISNATVTGTRTGDASATPSADYAGADGSTAFQVFQAGDTIKASTGTTAATAGGATDGTNGTTTHFDDNQNGKFKVYIKKGDTTETYVVGAITANGTYYGKLNGEGNNVTGIACTVTNWGTEVMSAKGATGYMANVNFTLTPSSIYSDSTTFQVVKIEMCEGDRVVSTWNANSTVNGTYMYIKETTTPGTPATVDYTLSNVTEKWISGVKYYTTATNVTPTATGITNVGYPAAMGNKVEFTLSGGAWTETQNVTNASSFDNWTTVKDTSTGTVTGVAKNLDEWANPQITATPHNINGNGTAKTSTKANPGLLVCDANGFVDSNHGSITLETTPRYGVTEMDYLYDWDYYLNAEDGSWSEESSLASFGRGIGGTWGTAAIGSGDDNELGHLQIYNGFIQYPNADFSAYNGGVNPDYSSLANNQKFNRYFLTRFIKSGTIASGTITLTTNTDPRTALTNGKLAIYLGDELEMEGFSKSIESKVLRINDGIATAYNWSNGATTCPINFEFKQESDYCVGYLYAVIVMTYDCNVKIGNFTLA